MPLSEKEAHRRKARGCKAKPTRHRPERWPFPTNYGDHFETPEVAYSHIAPWVKEATREKEEGQNDVYDPYFCSGAAAAKMRKAGLGSEIYHKREDFYKLSPKPRYCCLVTNPPYSDDHKERLLQYLLDRPGPFCLLLPAWVASRAYWRQYLWAGCSGREGVRLKEAEGVAVPATMERVAGVVYVVPEVDYSYNHPDGAGQKNSPFRSVWFLGGLSAESLPRALESLAGVSGIKLCKTLGELRAAVGEQVETGKKGKGKQGMKEGGKDGVGQAPPALHNPFARKASAAAADNGDGCGSDGSGLGKKGSKPAAAKKKRGGNEGAKTPPRYIRKHSEGQGGGTVAKRRRVTLVSSP
eukprot:Hpha_TRINITY_DN4078_c0_g1::TRINITY_DN4078_c0_g1_i1::g.63645::m.63645